MASTIGHGRREMEIEELGRCGKNRRTSPAIYRQREAVVMGDFRGEGKGEHGANGLKKEETAPVVACDWSATAALTRGGHGMVARRQLMNTARRRWRRDLAATARQWLGVGGKLTVAAACACTTPEQQRRRREGAPVFRWPGGGNVGGETCSRATRIQESGRPAKETREEAGTARGKAYLRRQGEVAVVAYFGRVKEGASRGMDLPRRGKVGGARIWFGML
uniref:Uncharacterized protein n=1 Tax=Oryza barthii TaxID=65489 RepID=A0A0D3EP66_9ORYZ